MSADSFYYGFSQLSTSEFLKREMEMHETKNHLLLICPLSSRQVKYLKLDVDDACISF